MSNTNILKKFHLINEDDSEILLNYDKNFQTLYYKEIKLKIYIIYNKFKYIFCIILIIILIIIN